MNHPRHAGYAAKTREIAELLDGATELQSRLSRLYAELATAPDPAGPREQQVQALQVARREALHQLGLAILQARMAGASVSLDWPSQTQPSAPTRAPVEAPVAEEAAAEEATTAQALAPPPPPKAQPDPARDPAAERAALLRLARHGLGPNWESQREGQDTGGVLDAVLDALGAPILVDDEQTLLDESRRVARETDRLSRWLQLDRPTQQLLLSYAAAKARYLQDRAREGQASPTAVSGLDPAFRAMNRYAKEYRPGFVWGLSRTQTPKSGSWQEDAERHWHDLLEVAGRSAKVETNPERALSRLEAVLRSAPVDSAIRDAAVDVLAAGVSPQDPRLLRMLEPVAHALDGRTLKPVRRALRQAMDEPDEDTDDVPALPPTWPCYGWTRDRVAVVVGGDRRAEAAERLRQVFGFAAVQWDSDVQGTKLANVAERVRNGSVHMVLFLARLSSHSTQAVLLEACKDSGVPFIRVERGYGVSSVRMAIEQLHGQAALT